MAAPQRTKICWRIAPQVPLKMRRRRQPPRAAAHHLFVSAPLHFGRHQRPTAFHTRSALVRTLFVSPAMAASARAPQRQRFGVEALDRRERGFPLRRFVVRCPALPEQPAPARFSLPPFFHASRRFPSCAPSSRPATAGRGDHPQLAQQAKDGGRGVGRVATSSAACPLHHPSGGPPPPLRFTTRGRTNKFVLAAHPRPSFAHQQRRTTKRGKRSAERRIQPWPHLATRRGPRRQVYAVCAT